MQPLYETEPRNFASVAAPLIPAGTGAYFPVGLYAFPKGLEWDEGLRQMAEGGLNLLLVRPTVKREELDLAYELDVRVMIPAGRWLDVPEDADLDQARSTIQENLGPGSMLYEHPAVVAVEQPDEPLWNQKGRIVAPLRETFAQVWSATERAELFKTIAALKRGYTLLHEVCGDRYQVWLNFAPRGHESELRWYSDLPPTGGYTAEGGRAADVFGTDIYPVPDGGGNNGWVNSLWLRSPGAVGLFTDRLRRAFAPYPYYMVLHGCGILDWARDKDPAGPLRRPTRAESRYMSFAAVIHGARGILYWSPQYIEPESLMWSDLKAVGRELRAIEPLLLEGEPWPEAFAGTNRLEVLGLLHRGGRYLLVANPDTFPVVRVRVPGWRGERAYSLLDGRTARVIDEVLIDDLPQYGVRVYADGADLFARCGRPRGVDPAPAESSAPLRGVFGLPTDQEPFAGKSAGAIADLLASAGVEAVIRVPLDDALIAALHVRGIRAYGAVGILGGTRPWEEHPETRPVQADGTALSAEAGHGGICPTQGWHVEEQLRHIEEMTLEHALDGVWLDFIRWPGRWEGADQEPAAVCFCDTCLSRFHFDRGVHYPPDLETREATAEWILREHPEEWYDWREDIIADIAGRARRIVKRNLGPDALVGVFVVPLRRADGDNALRRIHGQNRAKLGEVADVLSPMVYHRMCGRDLDWIGQVCAEVAAESQKAVWPIVQAASEPTFLDVDEFMAAVRRGAEPPARGVIVFSTKHVLAEGKWDALARVFEELKP